MDLRQHRDDPRTLVAKTPTNDRPPIPRNPLVVPASIGEGPSIGFRRVARGLSTPKVSFSAIFPVGYTHPLSPTNRQRSVLGFRFERSTRVV